MFYFGCKTWSALWNGLTYIQTNVNLVTNCSPLICIDQSWISIAGEDVTYLMNHFECENGKKFINDGETMIVVGRSLLECGAQCKKFDNCFGYNFSVLQKLCEVFRGYTIGQAVVNANYTFCSLAFYI